MKMARNEMARLGFWLLRSFLSFAFRFPLHATNQSINESGDGMNTIRFELKPDGRAGGSLSWVGPGSTQAG
jgi:hypothetical protein